MKFELKGVSHSFDDGTPVLRDIDLAINPGERVALVGKSGSGKSTIASLIRRDFDPAEGVVLLDGRDLRTYNLHSVLRYMGIILQESMVISGTVRENLCFALTDTQKRSTTDSDLWAAIDLVSPNLRTRFTDGLDTLVGKQGLELSGGERQRLAVIRAILKRPRFMLIDEATSSLDTETQDDVQAGIDTALASGVTALVIAHRFSTLRSCTKFVCMKRITEWVPGESQIEAIADSFEALYDVSPTFRELYERDRLAF